jgi:hypothetical protein
VRPFKSGPVIETVILEVAARNALPKTQQTGRRYRISSERNVLAISFSSMRSAYFYFIVAANLSIMLLSAGVLLRNALQVFPQRRLVSLRIM